MKTAAVDFCKTGWNGLRHIFFPHICSGCGTDLLPENKLLCIRCLNNLPVTNFQHHSINPVEKIFRGRLRLVKAFSYLYFTKDSMLQSLLHELKYKGKKEIGEFLGNKMGEAVHAVFENDPVDALIPLPLHPAKERQRGFNQATAIANGLAEVFKIPVMEKTVARKIFTASQTKKSRLERWDNMEGKFILNEEDAPYGKHVLLVDDVVTTGATLEACGNELLKTQGLRLSISTLAYSVR